MTYQYFHIRYFETKDGRDDKAYSAFHYTSIPSSIDSLKSFLKERILKNPLALVTIFSLQLLERDKYVSMGGIAPAE